MTLTFLEGLQNLLIVKTLLKALNTHRTRFIISHLQTGVWRAHMET